MTICTGCSLDFYGLAHETCYKCKELSGKSDTEKVAIRKKGQCLACSVVYSELQAALCATCCQIYVSADSIPKAIFELPGASEQLLSFQTSDFTAQLWEVAQGYKKTASDHRLGLPRTQNPSLQKAALAAVPTKKAAPGISKGATILQEMKDKREQGKKVKFTVLLCKSKPTKGKGGFQHISIPNVRPVENINEDMATYDALDLIVNRVQEYHGRAFPAATKICRQMITFYASESVTKYANIPEEVLTTGTVTNFLLYFRSNGHISSAQWTAKQLELKLVVEEADLYLDGESDFAMPSASMSARPRGSVRGVRGSAAVPGRMNPPRMSEQPPRLSERPVRKSAWPVKPSFARPCSMVAYKFRRYIKTDTDHGMVFSLPKDAPVEVILVAADWMEGASMAKANDSFHKTGFLGSGTSKNVIYARVGNDEYALGQAQDVGLDNHSHLQILIGEWKNLLHGAMILDDFCALANEYKVVLPRFKFNIDGAILGALEPFEGPSNNDTLLLNHFLATRFLPCGPTDTPIQKFTGNTDCGGEPTDFLTQGIHAFSHYVPIYTGNELVLCDLQGMCDRNGVMTLVDPQSHSSEPDINSRAFWDNGPGGIKTFLRHHLTVCHKNDICNRLQLQELAIEHTNGVVHPRSPCASPERPTKKPHKAYRHGFPDQ
ncbi:hypothetical protein C8R46DRAFT_1234129 [Mycena filopes]|nr:hypothetical protein C8R46DRAFT_1234129 [Mycena filopes]